MSHYHKYLKYKNKYLSLKNQIGGVDDRLEEDYFNRIRNVLNDQDMRRYVFAEGDTLSPVLMNWFKKNSGRDIVELRSYYPLMNRRFGRLLEDEDSEDLPLKDILKKYFRDDPEYLKEKIEEMTGLDLKLEE